MMIKRKYIWIGKSNEIISCDEKLKVLNENFDELGILIQNVIDDAVIIGCDEKDLKKKINELLQSTSFSFKK